MQELTREEKTKIFEKLPKELQNLMNSENTGVFLLYLGDKHALDDEKISIISKIIGDVILGILPLINLSKEINDKALINELTATNIAQEINDELFAPVANLLKGAPTTTPKPVDSYRESDIGPEVIDLRKTPPPPMPAPVAAAPIPPVSITPKPISPLTFTKPVEPPVVSKIEPPKPKPLIEANPHLPEKISPEISTGKIAEPPAPSFTMRPPGLPPEDVVDLRQNKGEF